MRSAGATFASIAEQTGHKSAAAAAQDFARAMACCWSELAAAGPDLNVVLELERLDTLERVTQNLLRQATSDGARHDPALALRAVDRLVRISWRRSALIEQSRLGAPAAAPAPSEDLGEDRFDEVEAARARRRANARA